MKIVHVCVQSPYNDYWGYQDNLLPKAHARLGHDVTVITTNTMHHEGKIVEVPASEYVLDDGVRIIRLPKIKLPIPFLNRFFSHYDTYSSLEKLSPDFIMMHGISSLTIMDISKYKKRHPKCQLVADNHLDDINTGFKSQKSQLIRLFIKVINKTFVHNFSRVFCVTPTRIEYAVNKLGVPRSKCELLVMGGDDEKIDFENQSAIRNRLRNEYNISAEDFLIVTGGKIDRLKNIHLLMEAVIGLPVSTVHLVVFGEADKDMVSDINILSQDKKLTNIGWIPSEKAYDWFLASDLAVFPGTHSVLWEQAVASSIPCVFKYWTGMDHVDVGGNCKFLYRDSKDEIAEVITDIMGNPSLYEQMKSTAVQKGIFEFSYLEIAKRAINFEN